MASVVACGCDMCARGRVALGTARVDDDEETIYIAYADSGLNYVSPNNGVRR